MLNDISVGIAGFYGIIAIALLLQDMLKYGMVSIILAVTFVVIKIIKSKR